MENDLQLRVGQALTENQQLIELLVKKNTMLEEVIAEQGERLETWDRVENAVTKIEKLRTIILAMQFLQENLDALKREFYVLVNMWFPDCL